MEYMDANRGKHFDPHLVDLFRIKRAMPRAAA
jgi:HD-GYP domain-containing protein (c-di-GMP phosphodiesterase class II)